MQNIDMITILCKRSAPDSTPDWVMQSRLDTGMKVYKENPGAKLVVQGSNSYDDQNAKYTEAEDDLRSKIISVQDVLDADV